MWETNKKKSELCPHERYLVYTSINILQAEVHLQKAAMTCRRLWGGRRGGRWGGCGLVGGRWGPEWTMEMSPIHRWIWAYGATLSSATEAEVMQFVGMSCHFSGSPSTHKQQRARREGRSHTRQD